MRHSCPGWGTLLSLAVAALLSACAGGPMPPDWQMNSKAALEDALAAYLAGNTRVEAQEFQRAIGEISATGKIDLLARAELTRCAAQVASLVFEECAGFLKLKLDANAPERAYADYLAAQVQAQHIALLPPQHRTIATAGAGSADDLATLKDIADPLSRLVAAGVLLQMGRASPGVISTAVDTASAQGWRRPLLAWLLVQTHYAEHAGATDDVERLRRRIGVVQGRHGHQVTKP